MYQIRDWDEIYENSRSRIIKDCRWVAIPNKQDGLGYSRLITGHGNGAAHYGVWVAIACLCSRQTSRQGYLTNDGTEAGTPLTTLDISLVTRISEECIKEAIPRFIDIGWMLNTGNNNNMVLGGNEAALQSHSIEGNRREGKGIEKKKREEKEGVATSVPTTFIELSRTFLEKQKERYPKESALKDFEARVTDGAEKLYLFHTENNWTEDEIRDLLDWVLEDDFWGGQIRTLGGIRNRKKDRGKGLTDSEFWKEVKKEHPEEWE